MTLQEIIQHNQARFFNCIEVTPKEADVQPYIDELLADHPEIQRDAMLLEFIQNYEMIQLMTPWGEISLYGADMILELNEPPLDERQFMGFANYSRETSEVDDISATFMFNLTDQSPQGIYMSSYVYKGREVIKKVQNHFFAPSFAHFLHTVFNWIETTPSIDEILNYLPE